MHSSGYRPDELMLCDSRAIQPRIVFGVTHPQTCLTLTGRLRAFREAGFRVTLVCSPGALMQRIALNEGAEAVELPIKRKISLLADVVSFLRLCRLLRKLNPQIVEFSTPTAGLHGSIAAWICRVPVRIYMLRGLKLERSSGLNRLLLLAAERLAAGCAHVVLCNSLSLRDAAEALGVAPASKLHVLGFGSSNGVDIVRYAPRPCIDRRQHRDSMDGPMIGFVGRLTCDKGLPELLEAFERLYADDPSLRLLLVGWFDAAEDALDRTLLQRIEQHPGIHVTGFVHDTAFYYNAMDVLVLPSWREGFPNAVLEASASGLPVITTTCTGARDSVLPGRTGLLVPPGDSAALAAALRRLMRDPELRACMGVAARAWIVENFVAADVLERAVRFYRLLLEGAVKAGSARSRAGAKTSAASLWEAAEVDRGVPDSRNECQGAEKSVRFTD